jgi:hypothetical protein
LRELLKNNVFKRISAIDLKNSFKKKGEMWNREMSGVHGAGQGNLKKRYRGSFRDR